ncbi:MAG TPA: transporter [Flavobacterium sp.]|nr:transporter [Flavobacterium sp.]
MKKNNYFLFVIVFFSYKTIYAQNTKWTLENCIKYAIKNNISVKNIELDVKNSEIDKKTALGNFLPSLNLNATHSWNIGLNQDITTGLLRNQTTQFTSASASVGIDIYKGLKNLNTLRLANLSKVATQYQLLKMKEDITLNVVNAFLQILFNQENLKVQLEQLNISENQLIRSEELVSAGTLPRGDILDIKASVTTNIQNVIIAENTLLISKLSLSQLLQLKDFDTFNIATEEYLDFNYTILNKDPNIIYEKAIENRTEIKIAKTNLEIAQKNLVIARGGFYPSLTGFYNFNSRVSDANDLLKNSEGQIIGIRGPNSFLMQFNANKGQSFGGQLTIPLFNGFTVKNNVERSKVLIQKSKMTLQQQEQDLQRNVYTAFIDAKGALKAYESTLKSLEARQQSYKFAKERYEMGMINSFELNQSQALLANAQSDVIKTKYDFIFKIKILEFYFGIPIIKN